MTKPRTPDRRTTSARRRPIAAVSPNGHLDPVPVQETRLAHPALVAHWKTRLAILVALMGAGGATRSPDMRVLALLAIVAVVALLAIVAVVALSR